MNGPLAAAKPQSCKAKNGVATTDAAAGVASCQVGFPGNCPTTSRDEEDLEQLVLDLRMGRVKSKHIGGNSRLHPFTHLF